MIVTLNGHRVLSAVVQRPRLGAWWADVEVDAATAPTGSVTLAIEGDATLTLVGTAHRTGTFGDTARLRIAAGAGALGRTLGPKFYRQVPFRVPLLDVLTAVGEKLDAASDASMLAVTLTKWTRVEGTAEGALAALLRAKHPAASMRVTNAGAVWVGLEAWQTTAAKYEVLEDDVRDGRMVLASEDPTIAPGTLVEGRRARLVVHRIEPVAVRTEIWTEAV